MSVIAMLSLASLAPRSAGAFPTLLSVSPREAEQAVFPNSPIEFYFSSPMQPTQLVVVQIVSGAPYTQNTLFLNWSPDGRRLTVQSANPFPAGATVLWSIDEKAFAEQGHGDPLDKDYGGTFVISTNGLVVPPPMLGMKFQSRYLKSSGLPPRLATNGAFEVVASVRVATAMQVVAAGLSAPLSEPLSLLPTASDPATYTSSNRFNDEAALRSVFPRGAYRWKVTTGYSDLLVETTLPDFSLPPAPELLNDRGTENVDPTLELSLQIDWHGSPSNYAAVRIVDREGGSTVFSTPAFGSPMALTGVSNRLTVSANTLQPGAVYDLAMELWSVSTDATGSLPVETWIGSSTAGTISVRPVPVRIVGFSIVSTGLLEFQVQTKPGSACVFERASDFAVWEPVSTNIAPSELFTATLSRPTNSSVFFRVRRP